MSQRHVLRFAWILLFLGVLASPSLFGASYYNLGAFWSVRSASSSPAPVARLISTSYDGGNSPTAGMSSSDYEISTTGVNDGDLLLAFACTDSGNPSIWTPGLFSGFTTIRNDSFGNDGENCIASWKVAYNEPASLQASYKPASGSTVIVLIAVTGFSAISPVESSSINIGTGVGANPIVGSTVPVTTTKNNSLIVYASGSDWEGGNGTVTFAAPSSSTALAQLGDHGNNDRDWTSLQVASKVQAAAGGTGVISGTQTDTNNPGLGWTVAVVVPPQIPLGGTPSRLAVTSAPQTLPTTWACSSALSIQLQDSSGVAALPNAGPVTVSLGGDVTYFSDAGCENAISSVQIMPGTVFQTVYFEAPNAGTQVVNVSASGLTSGTQNETVTAIDPFTWVGGASCDGTWSLGVCWAGGSSPGGSDSAHFDAHCTLHCAATLGADATIGGLYLHPSSSSVNWSANNLTVTNLTVDGGALGGGSGTFFVSGDAVFRSGTSDLSGDVSFDSNLKILGGTVNLTGQVSVRKDYVVSGGTLTTTGSTLSIFDNFAHTYSFRPGATPYNNVVLEDDDCCNGGIFRNMNGDTLTVSGTLTIAATGHRSSLMGGTIKAKGNVVLDGVGYIGDAVLQIAGSGNQTVDASGTTVGVISNLTIASTGGTVTFKGAPMIWGNYAYSSGTVDFATNSSTLVFFRNLRNDSTISPGSVDYYNVTFMDDDCCNGGNSRTLDNGSVMKVKGTLTIDGTGHTNHLMGGTLEAFGNVVVGDGGYDGTTQLLFGGSGSSTLSISGGALLPAGDVTVAKTGGATVTLLSAAAFDSTGQNLNITSGTMALSGHQLTVNSTLTMSAGTVINEGGSCVSGAGQTCSGDGFASSKSTYLKCNSCVGCTGTATITCP